VAADDNMPTAIWETIVMHEQLTGSDFDREITVVIPTLNEETALSKVLEELWSLGIRNILIVDGYSSDGTIQVAKKFGVSIIFQQGKGKTGALKTAIDHVKTPYMLIMDGDFTYDPGYISRFKGCIGFYDEIIGARLASDSRSMTRFHKFGNKLITKLFNMLMNTNISDVCSGMYMLRTQAAKNVELSTSGFDVEAEIAAQIASAGRLTEVPVNYRPRLGRQKLSAWRHGFRIIRTILKLARIYNPTSYYSILGIIIFVLAGSVLARSLIDWSLTPSLNSGWVLIGISMLILSLQTLIIGTAADTLRRKWSRSQQEKKTAINELSARDGMALPALEEILNVTAYEDIKAAWIEAIRAVKEKKERKEEEEEEKGTVKKTKSEAQVVAEEGENAAFEISKFRAEQ
jgi:dolichol-phosphate hexosyltransferase